MQSQFSHMTDDQEKSHIKWQTAPILNYPAAIQKLATVVNAIEVHFLTPEWDSWPGKGSVTFQRKSRSQWVVRVFIDDNNRLARHLGQTPYSPEPIVVGIDLTDYDPFTRYAIREMLRTRHGSNYIDPEQTGASPQPRKILVPGDHSHFLDVVFIPDGPCDYELDELRILKIIEALQKGSKTWS